MIIFLFDLSIRYNVFMNFSLNFKAMLLAIRGRTCVPRGCSRTLKPLTLRPCPKEIAKCIINPLVRHAGCMQLYRIITTIIKVIKQKLKQMREVS